MAQGVELIETVILLSGLPREWAYTEIESLLKERGFNIDTISLEEFREIMVDLVQTILVRAKEFDQEHGLLSLVPGEGA